MGKKRSPLNRKFKGTRQSKKGRKATKRNYYKLDKLAHKGGYSSRNHTF